MEGAEDDDEAPVIEEVPRDGDAAPLADGEQDQAEGDGEAEAEPEEVGPAGEDKEMARIEKEKEGMTVLEKLERSFAYRLEGNDFFKAGDLFRASDCYYRAVLYSRDLMQNPKYYPKLGHTEQNRETARGLVESAFSNLALVQSKHALSLPEGADRERILREAARSAGEAVKINAGNAKALYRRGLCRSHLARAAAERAFAAGGKGEDMEAAASLCAEAKADLTASAKADEKGGRDARTELKAVQELAKRLRQEELSRDKQGFSFQGSLSALRPKEQDLLGDGSVRKLQSVTSGDGARWFNEDWLLPTSRQRCVVHVRCRLLGGEDEADVRPVSFALGDVDMHEGLRVAVRSLSKGEAARFAIAERRMAAASSLARRLPAVPEGESNWELELVRFALYEDSKGDGQQLVKVFSEGYGRCPEDLSECHLHWKVLGADDATIYSSRRVVSIAEGSGIEQREDPEREPYVYVLGETTWPPVATLCRALRQGGHAELRLKRAPALPETDPGAPADVMSTQLNAMLNKRAAGKLEDCSVHVELERVAPPMPGPGDEDWGGVPALVQERFRAEQLLEKGEEDASLRRFRRAAALADRAAENPGADAEALAAERAELRAGLAWVLAKRAAPILDLGTVSSDCLKAAEADLAEAEAQCDWLDEHRPGLVGTRLVRAKLLVARDDDFEGASAQLMEAQRLAPDDARVQLELKTVRSALRSQREVQGRERLAALRDSLAAARAEGLGAGAAGAARITGLLTDLAALQVSWEAVMETRVGVEVKKVREESADTAAQQLCADILGKWMDQSKEQRPLWES